MVWPCKFFQFYKRCKFLSFCKYSHEIFDESEAGLKKKISTLEKEVSELKWGLKETLIQIESLKKEMEKKEEFMVTLKEKNNVHDELIGNFENMNKIHKEKINDKIDHFENTLEEKAKIIDSLKEAMDYCNDTFAPQCGIQIYP